MDLSGSSEGNYDDSDNRTSIVNSPPQSTLALGDEHHDESCPAADASLKPCQQSSPQSASAMKEMPMTGINWQTPTNGTRQTAQTVPNGGSTSTKQVTTNNSDQYHSYPYLPSLSDVPPSDIDVVHSSYGSRRHVAGGDAYNGDDEPLLDLSTSSGTDVDHCHAATGSEPDTSGNRRAQKQLMFAASVCFLFMIGELVGGAISGSLAIMTDAAHLLSDFTSFLISLFALWLARRPPTAKMSFGYLRAEILGAVISVLMIWIATGVLVYLAIKRCITQDYEIDGEVMLITAGCGLGINILLALVLHFTGHSHSHGGLGHGHSHGGGSHDNSVEIRNGVNSNGIRGRKSVDSDELLQHEPLSIQSEPLLAADADVPDDDLEDVEVADCGSHKPTSSESNMNVRAAFIHILGDLIQSVGVCIAAVIILVQPSWKIADPICTFIFSVLVLVTTIVILRDAIQVLMEGVPRHINLHNLRSDLKSLPHVRMAHGLHVWSLTTSQAAMAVHLCIDADQDAELVLQQASQLVRSKYNIIFSTIQVEHYQPEVMNNCGRCQEHH